MAEPKAKRDRAHRRGEPGELQILYVATFPPRICGIATFTQDLTNAMDAMLSPSVCSVITAMNPLPQSRFRYPHKVISQIIQEKPEDYLTAARKINEMERVAMVSIQHEFGIFGGERGANLIPFMEELTKPSCITFHTVFPVPDQNLKNTVSALAHNSNAVIVMTNSSEEILSRDYGIPKRKIKIIPHGIHSQPYVTSERERKRINYPDRVVMSTFGLLGRNKGLEYVINALPRVIKEFPNCIYIIFGATHPVIRRMEGESYRNELIQKVRELGLTKYVKFYNRYFPLEEMLRFLSATDIYISPSLDTNQAVSGTLSYALGTGRPVISTAFTQAREIVTDDLGLLVDFRNPDMYAEAMIRLLRDEEMRVQMGKNAYFRTRNWTWPNVALQYSRVFASVTPALVEINDRKSLPEIKLDHVKHLTDKFGIVQFANLTHRDKLSGYTLDDNSRALIATCLYWEKMKSHGQISTNSRLRRSLLELMETYLKFIGVTAHSNGEFPNFIKANKTLDYERNSQVNLEEPNGRAVFALALAVSTASLPPLIKRKALEILRKRINNGVSCSSPRALAHWVKALCILINRNIKLDNINLLKALRIQADHLIKLYKTVSDSEWQWYEPYLTYSNGVLPEAMMMAYKATGDQKYLTAGKKTLDFLIEKSIIKDVFMPIGQAGWYRQSGRRYKFDQQPEEVRAIVYALKAGYEVTGDEKYRQLMRKAFYWFLGDNSLHQVVYDRSTGGCYDGVGRKNINLNQGAESTISYLIARLAFD